MKFRLEGRVIYAVGSCHDDRSVSIDKRFSAKTKKDGIEKARAIVQEFHKQYSCRTDYSMWAKLHMISAVWETQFRDAESAEPAEPAKPARPAKPERFEERALR